MRKIREIWVLDHFDWYTTDPELGYVPTELAPPEAVEAMERLNAMTEDDIE